MTTAGTAVDLPVPWQNLREAVIAERQVLSLALFDQVLQVFIDEQAGKIRPAGSLTREYRREEFLLVVDDQGAETGTAPGGLQRFDETVAKQAVFGRWFKKACLPDGRRVLLVARWLCHLIGLRHRTVEIFIDPPHLTGHTLVQVRGMEKYEAPGTFDIPCAGHVSGDGLAEESLGKELAEELNLSLADLSGLHLLARYNSYTGSLQGECLNNEYRFLYRARLKSRAAKQIRFTDGEVAGLAVFSVAELRALVVHYPERIASGLSDAMIYYI